MPALPVSRHKTRNPYLPLAVHVAFGVRERRTIPFPSSRVAGQGPERWKDQFTYLTECSLVH